MVGMAMAVVVEEVGVGRRRAVGVVGGSGGGGGEEQRGEEEDGEGEEEVERRSSHGSRRGCGWVAKAAAETEWVVAWFIWPERLRS